MTEPQAQISHIHQEQEPEPEFDTQAWRELRNRKLREWVGNDDAVQFILAFAEVCEVWDDLIDKDKPIDDDRINSVFWTLLAEMPLNPFFDRFKANLIPILSTGINAWLDANELEKRGTENDLVFAYVLRDWYMEFVSFVIMLTRGRAYMREVSMEVRRFFTHQETLDEYRRKLI